MKNFYHSTDHDILQEILSHRRGSFWIAGGAALSWYRGLPVSSDIDVFFPNAKTYDLMNQSVKKRTLPSTPLWPGIDGSVYSYTASSETSYTALSETENAVTYDVTMPTGKSYKLQLIKRRFYVDAQDLLADFDISVCQIATDLTTVWTGQHFAEDVQNNRLRVVSANRNTPKRLVKYWTLGFVPEDSDIDSVLTRDDLSWEFSNDEYNHP